MTGLMHRHSVFQFLFLSIIACLVEVVNADASDDSLRVGDTVRVEVLPQTTDSTQKIPWDSTLLERFPELRPVTKIRPPRFSAFDTLVSYFASERLNRSAQISRSYHFDAGDYFRFDPSFVALDYIITPMRKTVKPYGLTGDHLGVLANDMSLRPFDHPVEPDGLIDFSDIPTSTDQGIYLLPGTLGEIFGARHHVATFLARPIRPLPREAHSALILDKGSYGLSYARSRYSRGFSNGREIDMGIAYRFGDGYSGGFDDNAYAYDGDLVMPLNDRIGMRATGHLYRREGHLAIPNDDVLNASFIQRYRFDRNLRLLFESFGSDGNSRSSFGYTHSRQGSYLGPDEAGDLYKGRFNLTDHGAVARRYWLHGQSLVTVSGKLIRHEYDNAFANLVRHSSELSALWARPFGSTQYAVVVGAGTTEHFGFLPHASIVWKRESVRSLLMGTIGYSERAPTLHELYLPKQNVLLYSGSGLGYEEKGNRSLKSERQVVMSLQAEIGKMGNAAGLTVAAGQIWDAIGWQHTLDEETGTLSFSPFNDDITFATTTVTKDIHLGQCINFHGGASYHFVDYASNRAKTYQPDYQAFGGAELHVFWKQKLIHLYAYGEAVYLGPFEGYRQSGLGQTVVFNTKVSFSMGSFRFHLVHENVLNGTFENREYSTMPGQTLFWGFTWHFLD